MDERIKKLLIFFYGSNLILIIHPRRDVQLTHWSLLLGNKTHIARSMPYFKAIER